MLALSLPPTAPPHFSPEIHYAWLGWLIGVIIGAFDALQRVSLQVLVVVVNALRRAIGVLDRVASFIWDVTRTVAFHALKTATAIKDGVVKHIIPKTLMWIRRIREALKNWAQPLTDYLHKVQALWDWYFKQYILPFLNLIQRVRNALTVFRLFHLKFADKLDKYLSDLEGRIFRLAYDQRAAINRLLNYINMIIDPAILLQADLFLGSLKRSLDEISALVHFKLWDPAFTYNALTAQGRLEKRITDACNAWIDAHIFDTPPPETEIEKRIRLRCEKLIDRLIEE